MIENEDDNKIAVRRKNPVKPLQVTDHGRIPPQAIELEEVVLGALMLEQNAVNTVIDVLQPDFFYKEANSFIFEAIKNLFNNSLPIDMLTVIEELKKEGRLDLVGGVHYIAFLTNRVVSSANVEYHSHIIAQKYIKRKLIEISSEIINSAFEDTIDVFDLLDTAEDKIFKITEENINRRAETMPNLLRLAKEQIDMAASNTGDVSGVPSGFKGLDLLTSGWQNSDLIIVAARPGMGKTAFVLSMTINMAVKNDFPVALFSLEMSATQLVMRLISSEARISSEQLRKGDLNSEQLRSLNDNLESLSTAKIYIDDTPALDIFDLRAKARRLKQKHDIRCIVIDYLQLMRVRSEGKGTNRELEISSISRSLKALAKELNIPIICLSQLSREVEKRPGDKRPQLSDLRESGAIEQDADMVIFIYRREYYFKDEEECKNRAELIVAKHRNGSIADIPLKFTKEYAKFSNLDDDFSHIDSEFGNKSKQMLTIPSKMNSFNEIKPDF